MFFGNRFISAAGQVFQWANASEDSLTLRGHTLAVAKAIAIDPEYHITNQFYGENASGGPPCYLSQNTRSKGRADLAF